MTATLTTGCTFCDANEVAHAARVDHGLGSAEHRAALLVLRPLFDLARVGKAHDASCPTLAPLVILG